MPGILSTAEIAAMRTASDSAMPDVGTVRRNSTTSDGGGGAVDAWADVAINVPCRMAPLGGGETGGTTADRVSDAATHVVTMPAETDIADGDEFVTAGLTYEVLLVRKRGAWELTRRAELRGLQA